MTSTPTRPLALKILMALLLLEGCFAWFRFLSGIFSGTGSFIDLSLVLPFAAWGLYKCKSSWRVLTLVFSIIVLILIPLGVAFYFLRDPAAEGRFWPTITFPTYTLERPIVGWAWLFSGVLFYAWSIYVLRRPDVVALFNGQVWDEEPKASH